MPLLFSLLGGAGIAYALIESGYAIEALILLLIWIALLWTFPALAMWMLALMTALAALAVVVVFWEFFAALLLAAVLFVLLVGGALHALKELN